VAKQDYNLAPDRRGAAWDALLYLPVVILLGAYALVLWYQGNQPLSYLLMFLACFMGFIGANRILSGRLMLLPSAPVALSVSKQHVTLRLRSNDHVSLVKEVRFFSDYAGKSFGLTGLDMSGKKRQYVFHRGQFESTAVYDDAMASLRIYK